ncbi:MAG TPA: hypothetical protein VFZ78_11730 [Flavisolibacter sp.]
MYFIHGDRDDWVPIGNVAHGIEMMTRAARIRSDTLFGAGHLIPWKNTDAFRLLLMNMD